MGNSLITSSPNCKNNQIEDNLHSAKCQVPLNVTAKEHNSASDTKRKKQIKKSLSMSLSPKIKSPVNKNSKCTRNMRSSISPMASTLSKRHPKSCTASDNKSDGCRNGKNASFEEYCATNFAPNLKRDSSFIENKVPLQTRAEVSLNMAMETTSLDGSTQNCVQKRIHSKVAITPGDKISGRNKSENKIARKSSFISPLYDPNDSMSVDTFEGHSKPLDLSAKSIPTLSFPSSRPSPIPFISKVKKAGVKFTTSTPIPSSTFTSSTFYALNDNSFDSTMQTDDHYSYENKILVGSKLVSPLVGLQMMLESKTPFVSRIKANKLQCPITRESFAYKCIHSHSLVPTAWIDRLRPRPLRSLKHPCFNIGCIMYK